MKHFLILISLFCCAQAIKAQTDQELLNVARAFPPMPRDAVGLVPFVQGQGLTFGSGTPFNDLEYTMMDFDYIDGENGGGDLFMPVDPSEAFPGSNSVKYIRTVLNTDLNASYAATDTDRIILGTAEIEVPFFSKGNDGIDNDYVVIHHFDYGNGVIQLRGTSEDYRLVLATSEDGVNTEGYYLFHTANGDIDLIAFIFPCDDLEPPVSGTPPQDINSLCNGTGVLDLNDPVQFLYAAPIAEAVALPEGIAQYGSTGKDVVGGVASDDRGNVYLMGSTDGDLGGTGTSENSVFISQINPEGNTVWVSQLNLPNGSLLFDAVADDDHVYVCGRTLGALPGASSAGRWDGIILKLDIETGTVVASDQWGNAGIDGYGNLVLDKWGHLYVSGQGSPVGDGGTDDLYLVSKHNTADLSNVWRQLNPTTAQGFSASAEAWGGLYIDAGATESDDRLVAAGWYIAAGGANCFVSVYENLDASTPQRPESIVFSSPGAQADWVLDNVVDSSGNIYIAGYTTGDLQGGHRGEGDAYIAKYSPDLSLIGVVQFGTERSDAVRKLEIDEDDQLYTVGYTYGDYAGENADTTKRTGDIMIQKFDSDLNLLVGAQYGTPHEERAYASLNNGLLYVGGMTEGNFTGASFGSFDGYALALDLETLQPTDATNADLNPPEDGDDDDMGNGDVPELVVYNVLTPNADGLNDFLLIQGLPEDGNNSLQIFNKNGILEFETQNYGQQDNLFGGVSQKTGETMQGTYLYILNYTNGGRTIRKTGYLQIQ